MTAGASAATGFAVGALAAGAATPAAIGIAQRTGFLDRPRGYREHDAPTPFLGGAAVLLGFLLAAAAIGASGGRYLVLLGCAVAMWILGSLDDGFAVPPKWRLLAATGCAIALTRVGMGWQTSDGTAADVALTVAWVVGLVNAFNLMDNLDGACSTVAAVAAAGIGVLAAIKGETVVAGLAFGLCGACAGFVPLNLAGPAKIFLGDGGSMPIGFLAAALAMATSRHAPAGNAGVLVGALLVALPIFDATLVSVSRTRRGVSLMTGGRDHLTHRILLAVRTPRWVAVVLAVAQGALCGAGVVAYEMGEAAVAVVALGAFVLGVIAILVLDRASWRPAGIAVAASPPVTLANARPSSVGVDSG